MTAMSSASGASVTTIFGTTIFASVMTSSDWRSAHGLRRLEGAGRAQHLGVVVQGADDLQADRKPGTGQSAGDRGRRLARHVERVTKRRPIDPVLVARVVEVLADRQCRHWHHRR